MVFTVTGIIIDGNNFMTVHFCYYELIGTVLKCSIDLSACFICSPYKLYMYKCVSMVTLLLGIFSSSVVQFRMA